MFGLSMGVTLAMLSVIVIIPLASLVFFYRTDELFGHYRNNNP